MISTSKIVGVVSWGFVLCVGLSDANAADYGASSEGGAGPTVIQEDQTGRGSGDDVIKGEVLRVEGDYLFVREEDGKEVRMHIDQTTKMSDKKLDRGELIEATIDEQNHALSIHSPDRRSDHTLESGQAIEPK